MPKSGQVVVVQRSNLSSAEIKKIYKSGGITVLLTVVHYEKALANLGYLTDTLCYIATVENSKNILTYILDNKIKYIQFVHNPKSILHCNADDKMTSFQLNDYLVILNNLGFTKADAADILSKCPLNQLETYIGLFVELSILNFKPKRSLECFSMGGFTAIHLARATYTPQLRELNYSSQQILKLAVFDTGDENVRKILSESFSTYGFNPDEVTSIATSKGRKKNLELLTKHSAEVLQLGIENAELVENLSDSRGCKTYRTKLLSEIKALKPKPIVPVEELDVVVVEEKSSQAVETTLPKPVVSRKRHLVEENCQDHFLGRIKITDTFFPIYSTVSESFELGDEYHCDSALWTETKARLQAVMQNEEQEMDTSNIVETFENVDVEKQRTSYRNSQLFTAPFLLFTPKSAYVHEDKAENAAQFEAQQKTNTNVG